MAEPRGPLRSPGFWLHHAALGWRQRVDAGLRPLGLTHTQFNLLASANWLTSATGPPTQQEPADLVGADRMMAPKVLASLEARGLIARTQDDADLRVRRVAVQATGRDLVRRAVRVVADLDARFFDEQDDGMRENRKALALQQAKSRVPRPDRGR